MFADQDLLIQGALGVQYKVHIHLFIKANIMHIFLFDQKSEGKKCKIGHRNNIQNGRPVQFSWKDSCAFCMTLRFEYFFYNSEF